jgi:DNA-binding beta-propeller fold protein YncE
VRSRITLATAVLAISVAVTAAAVAAAPDDRRHGPASHEVWTVDQSDTRPDGGGTLYIYADRELREDGASAEPERIDLGAQARDLCLERTGTAPVRPHMIVFNGGPDSREGNSHAALAFVASGHVLFLDTETREPVECIDAGTQAHAVWPTPDQRHLLVANQNGKLFQRIATDYDNERFTLEDEATLDLANGTTPSGALRQDPALRPDNAPICPRTDDSGRISFVTLRGGGMFVVDHTTTPMAIVAEYDREAVHPNGCGGIEARGKMYINSGAGGLDTNPAEHDVYAFDVEAFSTTQPTAPNTPAPRLVYSRDAEGAVDSHGVLLTKRDRFLWVADRIANDMTVVDTRRDEVVERFSLEGDVSPDPAPDLMDIAPDGKTIYVALRGPSPGSGGHAAVGATPGLGVIDVLRGGRSGELSHVARVSNMREGRELADPHAVRVRVTDPVAAERERGRDR